ncbi:MAG: hypothetical protein JXO72_01770 [Vicinamibacteria bacterium]|nr:hypothetical protein [Vicinamibacteria bacterium]
MRSSLAFWTRMLLGVSTAFGVIVAPPRAEAWGLGAYRKVHARAVRTLPKNMRRFFERHRLEMPTNAPDGNVAPEGVERRFAIDRYDRFPFMDFPVDESAFKQRHGANEVAAGRLPWLVQESFARLVAAYRANDKHAILNEADVLASCIADLHNPLALTENHDGQRTRQDGVWVRFAVRLPDALADDLDLKADVAHLIEDPNSHVFTMIRGSYIWLDNLLHEEEIAARNRTGYTNLYYEELERRVKGMIESQLAIAAGHAGSYWYTAWIRAGRPDLDAAN